MPTIKIVDSTPTEVEDERRPIEIINKVEQKEVTSLANLRNRKANYERQIQGIQEEMDKNDDLIAQVEAELQK